MMHSDTANVRYGRMLGFEEGQGFPGLWEGQGLWGAEDRAHWINLRELRAVRLLLQGRFARYVFRAGVSAIFSAREQSSCDCDSERDDIGLTANGGGAAKFAALIIAWVIRIEARWIQPAVNRLGDALSGS